MKFQNNEFSVPNQKVPLYGIKIDVCCAMNATGIIGPLFLETINSSWYVTHILKPLLNTCVVMSKPLHQLTPQTFLFIVYRMFLGDRIYRQEFVAFLFAISAPVWLLVTGNVKGRVSCNNPHIEDDLKKKHSGCIFFNSVAKLPTCRLLDVMRIHKPKETVFIIFKFRERRPYINCSVLNWNFLGPLYK